jgi:superfamily II DNA/RNA helicase
MVFFGSWAGARFHRLFLEHLKIGARVIHGDQSQQKHIEVFNGFRCGVNWDAALH